MRAVARQVAGHEAKLRDTPAFAEPGTPADEVQY